MNRNPDILVAGGGAVGMAIAYQLSAEAPDLSVTVIDSGDAGPASRAAGAMLGCYGEVTKYTLEHPSGALKFDMMRTAHGMWPDWLAQIGEDSGKATHFTPGTHLIHNTQGGILDEHNFDAVVNALGIFGEPYAIVDPRAIPGYNPQQHARALKAIFLPEEGSVDSGSYLRNLRRACEESGVSFVHDTILPESVGKSSGTFTLQTADERYETGGLILATGATTGQLVKESKLGIDMMPMFAGTGIAMTVARPAGQSHFEHTIRTVNRAGSCGLHLVPLEGNREYIGATNIIYTEARARASLGMSLFLGECAVSQLSQDLHFAAIERWRVGNRPISLDTLPLLGKTSLDGLYVATGTARDGFHCSPYIAKALVDSVLGRKTDLLDPFAPERPPIELMSIQRSTEETVLQEVSAAHEAGMRLPGYYTDDSLLEEHARRHVEMVYDELGSSLGLHPDIVLALTSMDAKGPLMQEVRTYLQRVSA